VVPGGVANVSTHRPAGNLRIATAGQRRPARGDGTETGGADDRPAGFPTAGRLVAGRNRCHAVLTSPMTVPLEALPEAVRAACGDLRDGLRSVLGEQLVALWVYGAVTFDDRPRRPGDVDTHAVVGSPLAPQAAGIVDGLHESIGRDRGVEWDSWYILEPDMPSSRPPAHALRSNFLDGAWALHRAHWLAGQYVLLHGRAPSELVRPPTWAQLEEALRNELAYIEGVVQRGPLDAEHAAYVVWNGCRIIYSTRTRDVVVSKRAAARWALDHTPASWGGAILAAGRAYDGRLRPGDAPLLQAAVDPIVAAVRVALA
jgi:hypothetical protein